MAQVVYGLTQDGGDGSSTIRWFKTQEGADLALGEEEFFMNEGYSSVLTFPDDLDLEACGFSFCESDKDD
jgi:hypothetical protein